MRSGGWIGVTAVLAAVVVAGCCASLLALNTGAGFGTPPLGFGLTQGYDAAAYRRMSGHPSAADISAATLLSKDALRLSPYATAARLRLVYIDTVAHHRLTSEGAAAYALSYDLVPIDPDVAPWRIRFGLEHWSDLPTETRQDVYNEAKSLDGVISHEINVRNVLNSVKNPAGRLAAAFWIKSWTRPQSHVRAVAPTNAAER